MPALVPRHVWLALHIEAYAWQGILDKLVALWHIMEWYTYRLCTQKPEDAELRALSTLKVIGVGSRGISAIQRLVGKGSMHTSLNCCRLPLRDALRA